MAATLRSTTAAAAHDVLRAVELADVECEDDPCTDALTTNLSTTPAANASGLTVLAIEDDPVDRFLLGEALSPYLEVEYATDIDAGIRLAWLEKFDAVLLDLGLPARSGLEALYDFRAAGPDLPLVVLSGRYSDQLGVDALHEGAQDYLCKDGVSTEILLRSIRYAIERHAMQDELEQLAVLDPLTGLLNRRGFAMHGHQAIARAARTEENLALLYLDVDGLKGINDTLGHAAGDQLLMDLADLLKDTLRSSDIIARVGGDEFCVLFTEGVDCSALAVRRLGRAIDHRNDTCAGLLLAVSAGVAQWDPHEPCSFDELVSRADLRMLEAKGPGRSHKPRLAG